MRLRAPHVCVLVLSLMAPALVHAQFGGLLKKKAAEALKGKPTPPAPKPGPATVSTSEPKAPAEASKSEPKTPASPLDISESLRQVRLRFVREDHAERVGFAREDVDRCGERPHRQRTFGQAIRLHAVACQPRYRTR